VETHCSYQGLPVHACSFRRTRGWTGDVSTVQFLARDFPSGFVFETPKPGDLSRPRRTAAVGIDWKRNAALFARRLHWVGPLVLAERDPRGVEHVVEVELFCMSVAAVRRDGTGKVTLVEAHLVDERFFWGQGFLRRWSFNRTGLDGEYRKDSLQDDGSPFPLVAVAEEAASCLFDRPQLGRVPKSWKSEVAEVEFVPFSSARGALIRLTRQHGFLEPCLGLSDGRLHLWRPGEGKLGSGEENKTPLPPRLFLHRSGTGQGQGTEATFPPDWIVIVGGVRVASVRLADLDPVLVIQGEPVPLTEKTIRTLTKGKHGLKWLAAFVLVPQAWQNDVDLRPEVILLLREQAWRLWRIPGVEQGVDAEVPAERIESLLSGLRQATRGERSIQPGPNAHLLPLLPRAETQAGRRLPVQVESYRFASVQVALAPAAAQESSAKTRQRLRQLRERIERAAQIQGDPSPWSKSDWFFLFSERYAKPQTLWQFVRQVQSASVSYEEFMTFFEQARLVDRIQETSSELGSAYDQELTKLYELDGELGGLGPELWAIAKELVAFEKTAAEQRDSFEEVDKEIQEQAATLRDKLAGALREVERKRVDRQRRRRSSTQHRLLKPQHAQFLRNLPLRVDPHASLFSAELGIVRTSGLSGHVRDPGVPVAEATTFVPKPPRVTFGAVPRPRLTSKRPTTGGAQAEAGPAALDDQETHYTAAFRRTGQGRVQAVSLADVPRGHGVTIRRLDFVELVPLQGAGNRQALDRTAAQVAREQVAQPSERVSGHLVLARPWAVECNGVVSGIEIRLRPGAKGFTTTVFLGSEARPLKSTGATQVRTPPIGFSDAAQREGA